MLGGMYLVVALGWLAMVALLASVIHRILGARVGLTRTVVVASGVLAAANPVITWAGVRLGIFGDDRLLVAPWTAVLIVGLVFLWSVVAAIALLVVLEVVVPTGTVPGPWSTAVGARDLQRRARRYVTLAWHLAMSGMGAVLRRGPDDTRFADALVRFLNRAGVTFVKLGQILATRTDLLPASTTTALSRLHSDADPVTTDAVREVLREEWGRDPEAVLRTLEAEPLAAASVAQVHRATLTDGRRVVVKVQRPGARSEVAIDSDILVRFSRTTERRFAWARSVGLADLARGLAANLREEVDYRVEAAHTGAVTSALAGHPAVALPRLEPDLCTSRVLVMSELSGRTAAEAASRLPADRRTELARELLTAVLESIFVHGVFHTDLHPGNIMLLDDDRLALLDFGSVGVLDAESRELLATLLLAIIQDDNVAAALALTMVLDVPEEVDQQALRRDLGRVTTYLAHQQDVDRAFGDVFQIVRTHGVRVPGDVAGMFRTLASLDATLRALDPAHGLLAGAREVMPSLLRRLADPARLARLAATQTVTAAAVARRLPARVEQVSDQLARGTLRISARPFAVADDRRWARALLDDAVSALFAVVGIVLGTVLFVADGSPQVTDHVDVFDLVGAGLAFLGAVLSLRLVVRLFGRPLRAPG